MRWLNYSRVKTLLVKEVFYLHRCRLAGTLMKEQSLTAIRSKQYVPRITDSKHDFGYNLNLLRDSLNKKTGRGEVFIGYITYLP